MGLAEVSQFQSPHLSVRETVQFWEVSERTLRRRLASGATGCFQDDSGQWCLSVDWVDEEFHRRRTSHPLVAGPELSRRADLERDDRSMPAQFERERTAFERSAEVISDEWVRELLEIERRATKAETELELTKRQLAELQHELQSAKGDLSYERSLVNRLKDQLRGES